MDEPIATELASLELTLEQQPDGRFAVTANGITSHSLDLAELVLQPDQFDQFWRDPRCYGRRLFAALFPADSPAGNALAHLPKASDTGGSLILVSQNLQAQAILWEYLHDGDDFLAVKYHLVRGIPPQCRHGCGSEMSAEALYLVVVPADPLLYEGRPVVGLNVRRELEHLEEALRKAAAPYHATILAPPTLDALHKALAPRERQTIVHFIGHGESTKEGALLLFEDETGAGRVVTAKEMIGPVRGRVFLVFLNACQSAMTVETPLSNLAYSLVMEGVPYALGMQCNMFDVAAVRLSEFFYAYLAQGHPVEEALRHARLALQRDDQLANVRWSEGTSIDLRPVALGIAVLYTSLQRGLSRFRLSPGEARIEKVQPTMHFDAPLTEAPFFRGRQQELVVLGQRLRDGATVITLAGTAGIGKSVLACRAAQRFAWRFPHGALGLSLETLPPREQVLSRLGRWLLGQAFDQIPPEEQEHRVADAFKGEARLLLLDNYETLLDGLESKEEERRRTARGLAQFFQKLVGGKGVLLITTRGERPTGLPGERQPLEVPGLDLVAALRLFRDYAGARWQDAHEQVLIMLQEMQKKGCSLDHLPPLLENEPLVQLMRQLEGHPLAIELFARDYATRMDSLTEAVREWRQRLREARHRSRGEDERHVTLAACFEHSFRGLAQEETRKSQELLPQLTVFSAPFLPQWVEAVLSVPEVEEPLHLLYRKGFLRCHEVGDALRFYSFHPMARWFAEEKAGGIDLVALQQNLGQAYRNFARQAYERFDPTYSRITRVILPDLQRAVGFLPAPERSNMAFHLGWLLRTFGDLDGAMRLYQESLAIDEQLGDQRGKSATLHGMAYIYRVRGDLDGAMRLYQEAKEICEQLGDQRGKSATLHDMAYIYGVRGDLDGAMRLYQESLAIKEQLGDQRGKSATLHEMAYIYCVRGLMEVK
nr:CHAT domain-containing protein [Chloroflexota bacterium]